jgi:hypothetical protein
MSTPRFSLSTDAQESVYNTRAQKILYTFLGLMDESEEEKEE